MMRLFVADSVCTWRGGTRRGRGLVAFFLFLLMPSLSFGAGGRIVPVIESVRQAYDLPAVAAAVILDGRVAGSDVKVTSADQFHLGSCTKAMTATLIAILVEKGKLGWDATLAELLPDLVEDMRPVYRTVTIRHLLAHRAGLPPANSSWPEGMSFRDVHRLPGAPMQQRLAYARNDARRGIPLFQRRLRYRRRDRRADHEDAL